MRQAPSADFGAREQMDLIFWAAKRTQGDGWANSKGKGTSDPTSAWLQHCPDHVPAPSLDPGLSGCCCPQGGTTKSRVYNTSNHQKALFFFLSLSSAPEMLDELKGDPIHPTEDVSLCTRWEIFRRWAVGGGLQLPPSRRSSS